MKKAQEAEFDKIFWSEKDKVYFTALKHLKSPQDAEEIVQEVFLKVFLALPKFQHKSLLSTWIYRIALNEIYSCFRKEGKKKKVELQDQHSSTYPLPEEVLEQKDMDRLLKKWISQMPKKRGKVLFLRIFENLSFKEIGEVVSVSENSAKSLFSLGLKELKNKNKEVSYE